LDEGAQIKPELFQFGFFVLHHFILDEKFILSATER